MRNAAIRTTVTALAIAAGLNGTVRADGFIHLLPRPGEPRATPLAMNVHRVEVTIDDDVAKTAVDEEFYNPNERVLEGVYLFPVPKGAVIEKFSMFIDGKETSAELLVAAEARKIYEDIVRRLRDPALLEYVDRDLFKVRVFPIPARGTKRVKIAYREVLKTDGGIRRYGYPLNLEKFTAAPIKTLSIRWVIRSKFPLKNIYCPTYPVDISRPSDHEARVGHEATNVRPDRDVELVYGVDDRDVGVNLLTYRPADEDGYFLALIAPKFDRDANREIAKDVCFVLDTSGSMAEDRKLDQARKALEFCLQNLGKNDRFNLVRFSTGTDKLFEKLETYSTHADAARRFLSDLQPRGGTNIHDALVEALKLKEDSPRPYLVIFITDGLPTVGVTGVEEILANVQAANRAGTRVFAFGVGYDVNTKLLDALAETTSAVSQYVKPNEDMEVKVSDFFAKVKDPALSQLVLRFEGIKVKDLYPRRLPDLFRGMQLVVAGRFEGSGRATIRLTGMVDDGRKELAYPVDFVDQAERNDFIPRFWATRKVAFLLDEIRRHGSNRELIDEATALAKKHGIVTPYTSYLILDDERKAATAAGAGRRVPMLGTPSADAFALAKQQFQDMARETRGQAAVRASENLQALKGMSPAGPMPALPDGQDQKTELGTKVRHVGPKTFFFNGTSWVDTEIDARPNQRKVKIVYFSEAYFKLLKDQPAIGRFLAVGENVLFSFNGVTYEVTK